MKLRIFTCSAPHTALDKQSLYDIGKENPQALHKIHKMTCRVSVALNVNTWIRLFSQKMKFL